MRTLINYPGAKWGMAEQICSLMPPHRSYLEPFLDESDCGLLFLHLNDVILNRMIQLGIPSFGR